MGEGDIREVVKVVLGDLLDINYILDPGVKGNATLQTGRPLRRDDLLPTLETLLRMNGAALVMVDGIYRVVPAAQAVALASPVMLFNNGFKVIAFRRHLDVGAAGRVMLL